MHKILDFQASIGQDPSQGMLAWLASYLPFSTGANMLVYWDDVKASLPIVF